MSRVLQALVAIATLLLAAPSVADEPTANVDSETAESLLRRMRSLNEDRGVTFLFSTHDPRVMAYARRNVVLVDGRVDSDARDP